MMNGTANKTTAHTSRNEQGQESHGHGHVGVRAILEVRYCCGGGHFPSEERERVSVYCVKRALQMCGTSAHTLNSLVNAVAWELAGPRDVQTYSTDRS